MPRPSGCEAKGFLVVLLIVLIVVTGMSVAAGRWGYAFFSLAAGAVMVGLLVWWRRS